MSIFDKVLSFFGILRESKMAEESLPTTIVQHRYEKTDVLERCLRGFGYRNYQIDDQNRPGIRIQLPGGKKLTDGQVKKVHAAYVAEQKKKTNSESAADSE